MTASYVNWRRKTFFPSDFHLTPQARAAQLATLRAKSTGGSQSERPLAGVPKMAMNSGNRPTEPTVEDAISTFIPDCIDPEERALREQLYKARDIATANLSLYTGDAQHLNLMIACVAQDHVFAPATVEQLRLALQYCRALMRAFASVELLNQALRAS